MNSGVKTLAFCLVIVISAWFLWQILRSGSADREAPEISYSTFISQAQAGDIARVSIVGTHIEGDYRSGKGRFQLTGPNNPAVFLNVLQDKGVEIKFRNASERNRPLRSLETWAPLVLLVALWLFLIRQMQRRTSPPSATGGGLDPSGGLR